MGDASLFEGEVDSNQLKHCVLQSQTGKPGWKLHELFD